MSTDHRNERYRSRAKFRFPIAPAFCELEPGIQLFFHSFFCFSAVSTLLLAPQHSHAAQCRVWEEKIFCSRLTTNIGNVRVPATLDSIEVQVRNLSTRHHIYISIILYENQIRANLKELFV